MAYHKKPSKKMYGGKKKKMYKKGNFLEPGKEIKFGGVKKMQSGDVREGRVASPAGRRRDPIDDTRRGATSAEVAARKRQETADAAAARRGASREEKQNTPQGTGAGRTGKSGSTAKPAGPAKGTYAYAKKQNPNIDALIKRRKTLTKGTPEYNKIQNQINKAYGKGPTNRDTTPIKKVATKPVKQVPTSRPTPTIKTPAKPAAPAAPAAKKTQDRRTTAVRFQSKADDRKARRASNKAGRQADRAGRKAGRLKKRLEKLQGKMMDGGKRKMGMGGYGKMKYGKGGLKMVKGKDGKMVPFYAADGKGKMMGGGMYKPYKAGGKKKSLKETTPDQKGLRKLPTAVRNKMGYKKAGGPAQQAAIAISMKKAGKKPKMMKKGGGMSGLSAAQKQVYKRGLAAYMSSGNRPKVSQHAWAMARVKSDFGKREAAKIRSGKSGKSKKK